jgi:CTP synthase
MVKWVFITGGVLSGLGKGLVSASVSKLLQEQGHTVVPIKCDGYLNVDPGTMNPHEHGEVFVLEDGGEVDMDFGHYERFLDVTGKTHWNLTSGKVFKAVIDKERAGEYLGKTVQMVPHVTEEIKDRFHRVADEEDADIVMVEVGGTVGDMENMMYLEAIRQMRMQHSDDAALIHTTLVPYLDTVGEQKTKPTQHSVKELQRAGLKPDFIVGRSEEPLEPDVKEKIALFCDVEAADVISNPDVDNIYRLPLVLREEGLDRRIADRIAVEHRGDGMDRWVELVENMDDPEETVRIALAGKYTDMEDSYASINEALKHAAAHCNVAVTIEQVETTGIEDGDTTAADALAGFDGVVITPGFGARGTDGKLAVAQYCRENGIPTLGICFGMQMMTIEYARNVCGIPDAHSTEVADDPTPVIKYLPEQADVEEKGGTMRLGGYTAQLHDRTTVGNLYGTDTVVERHRHRYEVNPAYHDVLQEKGLVFAGTSQDDRLVEFIELPEHPFYIGTQAHPEFTSQLEDPNPLYRGFVEQIAD